MAMQVALEKEILNPMSFHLVKSRIETFQELTSKGD